MQLALNNNFYHHDHNNACRARAQKTARSQSSSKPMIGTSSRKSLPISQISSRHHGADGGEKLVEENSLFSLLALSFPSSRPSHSDSAPLLMQTEAAVRVGGSELRLVSSRGFDGYSETANGHCRSEGGSKCAPWPRPLARSDSAHGRLGEVRNPCNHGLSAAAYYFRAL